LIKHWDYTYGGTDFEVVTSFLHTKDYGFMIGGYSRSGIGGDKTQASKGGRDFWIVKLDLFGNKQWDKDFGGTGDDELYAMQQTRDGGYILGGLSTSDSSGDKTQNMWGIWDYWIVKIDSSGNKEWDKDFGGTSNDALYTLLQTTDGGYILGGSSGSPVSGDKTQPTWGFGDFWIIKTDSLGNKIWDKDFGGNSYDDLLMLQQTFDGGFILGGISSSGVNGSKTQPSFGLEDYWIVKIDFLGTQQWDKDFGGTNHDYLYSLQQTVDSGFILGGLSLSQISGNKTQPNWDISGQTQDYWIVKIDSIGNMEWDKDFGGISFEDEFGNVIQTADGGYLISGTSYSNISGDKSESNLGVEQSWILKTDSLGNKQLDKTLLTFGHEEICIGIQLGNGCYVFAVIDDGNVGGYKTQPSRGSTDFWVIKFCDSTACNILTPMITQNEDTLFASSQYAVYQWYYDSIAINGATDYFYLATQSGNYNIVVTDSNGCSVGAGILNVIASVQFVNAEGQISISPNPSDQKLFITSPQPITHLKIFNLIGVQQSEIQNPKSEINISSLASGIYFIQLQTEDGSVVKKFVKE
jgi:hypothetical protein